MQLSNKNGNGQGEYQPEVFYRYLDADVWVKKDEITGVETVTYTEDVIAELYGESDSENLNPDDNNN
jgi:hypothetical protein